jgi:hypothetical protein
LILACGFAVASRSGWVVLGIVGLFFIIYLPVIRSEEAFLRQRFPQFEDYAHNVPSLLPRLTRFGNAIGEFSWTLYRKHREYNALLGAAVITSALVAKLIYLHR